MNDKNICHNDFALVIALMAVDNNCFDGNRILEKHRYYKTVWGQMGEVFFDRYPQHNGLLLFTIFANYNSQFVRNLEQGSKSDTELKKTLY